jgi:long-chain acyl-CoA synthetase
MFGCGFVQQYGMTETTGTVVYLPPEDHDPAGNARMRSAGLPHARGRAEDPRRGGQPAANEVGEVATRSPANMAGYWKLPEATADLSTPTAGCAPATPAISTRTAICSSTTG